MGGKLTVNNDICIVGECGAVTLSTGSIPSVLRTYDTINTESTEVVPINATSVVIRCWGGGGSGPVNASGGGGAFSETMMNVEFGDNFRYYVGQGGDINAQNGTIAEGGICNDEVGLDQHPGGGGSIVVFDNGSDFDLVCIAGGGGGGGIFGFNNNIGGYGGQPGRGGAVCHQSAGDCRSREFCAFVV